MYSYEKLNEYLNDSKNKTNRPLANNTRVIRLTNSSIGIKLHDTFVLTFYKDNFLEINTGGWQTNTTKDRINKYQDYFRIYTKNRIWYIRFNNKDYMYESGLVFDIKNNCFKEIKSIEEVKGKLNLKKQIDKYCNNFIESFINYKISKPSDSDCWYCNILREMARPEEHLISHMKEKYYVPSLLNNALNEYSDNLSEVDKHNIACIWYDPNKEHEPIYLELSRDRIKKILNKYMYKQFGFAS